MYALYVPDRQTLAADSALFDWHFEPLLAQLERAVDTGCLTSVVPEVEQYLAVCRWPFRRLEYSFALEAILERLTPGSSMLDAGAGVTPLSYIAALRGAQAFACDLDDELIRWLQQGHLNELYQASVTYTRQDLTALTYADGSFDVVTCISVLEHIPAPHDRMALRELLRVLKPGGLLVLTVDFQPAPPNGAGSAWRHYLRRSRTLAGQGDWRAIAAAAARKRRSHQEVRRSASSHARSAHQCFGVQHLQDDVLPIVAAWPQRHSELAAANDLQAVTTGDARSFWELQPGLFELQGERYVLPAALCIEKSPFSASTNRASALPTVAAGRSVS